MTWEWHGIGNGNRNLIEGRGLVYEWRGFREGRRVSLRMNGLSLDFKFSVNVFVRKITFRSRVFIMIIILLRVARVEDAVELQA